MQQGKNIKKEVIFYSTIIGIVLDTVNLTLGQYFSISINNSLRIITLVLALFSLLGTLLIGKAKLTNKEKMFLLIMVGVILLC